MHELDHEIPLPVAIDGYVRNIIELSVAIKEMQGIDDYSVQLLKEALLTVREQLSAAVEENTRGKARGDLHVLNGGGTH